MKMTKKLHKFLVGKSDNSFGHVYVIAAKNGVFSEAAYIPEELGSCVTWPAMSGEKLSAIINTFYKQGYEELCLAYIPRDIYIRSMDSNEGAKFYNGIPCDGISYREVMYRHVSDNATIDAPLAFIWNSGAVLISKVHLNRESIELV